MTICIAAICDDNTDDRKIILCTDRKVGGVLGSAETMLKSRTLGATGVTHWRCLTSGTDTDVLCAVRLLQNHFRAAAEIDERNVLALTRSALNERKRDKVDELIQGKFGISYDEFLKTGKQRLPEDIFRASTVEVEHTGIDAEFLVVGYSSVFPTLVKTDGRCGASIKEDFAVAGEGGYLAQASLMSRAYNHLEPFGRALYSVYEAKRFSQGAPSVGTGTTISILHQDGRHELVGADGLIFLEEKYKELGPKAIPDINIPSEYMKGLKTPRRSGSPT